MPSDVHIPNSGLKKEKIPKKITNHESKMGPVSLADIRFNLKINTDMLSLTCTPPKKTHIYLS